MKTGIWPAAAEVTVKNNQNPPRPGAGVTVDVADMFLS